MGQGFRPVKRLIPLVSDILHPGRLASDTGRV